MKPTRRTQPYKRGNREPSSTLAAMLAGRPSFLNNPADAIRLRRKLADRAAKKARRGR